MRRPGEQVPARRFSAQLRAPEPGSAPAIGRSRELIAAEEAQFPTPIIRAGAPCFRYRERYSDPPRAPYEEPIHGETGRWRN